MERINKERVDLPGAASETVLRLKGARILVVEDEVLIAMEMQANLEDAGAEVVGPCHTLADAVKEASVTRISAAVLDLKLGRVSIAPVARALSARSIPFIFYSGQAANDPIHAEWPDARIFSKPSPSGELIDALAMLLHQKPDRVF